MRLRSIIRFVSVNVFTSPWIPLWACLCYYQLIQLPEDASEKNTETLASQSECGQLISRNIQAIRCGSTMHNEYTRTYIPYVCYMYIRKFKRISPERRKDGKDTAETEKYADVMRMPLIIVSS